MLLEQRDPFRELGRLDQVWRGFGPRVVLDKGVNGHVAWGLPLDVVEEGDNIVVRASTPGMTPEDIEVTIEDNVLTIEGHSEAQHEDKGERYIVRERRSGSFRRALRLSDAVDTEKVESAYDNGVLTITLPKRESRKAKKVEVKIAS